MCHDTFFGQYKVSSSFLVGVRAANACDGRGTVDTDWPTSCCSFMILSLHCFTWPHRFYPHYSPEPIMMPIMIMVMMMVMRHYLCTWSTEFCPLSLLSCSPTLSSHRSRFCPFTKLLLSNTNEYTQVWCSHADLMGKIIFLFWKHLDDLISLQICWALIDYLAKFLEFFAVSLVLNLEFLNCILLFTLFDKFYIKKPSSLWLTFSRLSLNTIVSFRLT